MKNIKEEAQEVWLAQVAGNRLKTRMRHSDLGRCRWMIANPDGISDVCQLLSLDQLR
jgi:hypothetical protein